MQRSRRDVLVLTAGLFGARTARAGGSASAFVAELGERAIAVLARTDLAPAARRAALAQLLSEGFDVALIARLALGRPYRELDPTQRADYEELFRAFVLATYSARLEGYSGERLVVLRETATSGDDVLVATEIRRSGAAPLRVDWRVRSGPDGWKVVDVIVEGVSMVVTQRNEFQAVVAARGVAGLLDLLRARATG
jgi:phospholipid transport system substrate-binding protein